MTDILASELAPTDNPESLSTPKVPEVVSEASLRRNCPLVKPSRANALVAVPWNALFVTVVLSCSPGRTLAKPGMAGLGVNVGSLLTMPTMVSATKSCMIT